MFLCNISIAFYWQKLEHLTDLFYGKSNSSYIDQILGQSISEPNYEWFFSCLKNTYFYKVLTQFLPILYMIMKLLINIFAIPVFVIIIVFTVSLNAVQNGIGNNGTITNGETRKWLCINLR